MSNIYIIGVMVIAGCVFGLLYYHALWQTVKCLPRTRHPVVVLLVSAGLRVSLLLVAIYVVASGYWDRMIAALVGIIAARAWMVRHIRPSRTNHISPSTPDEERAV